MEDGLMSINIQEVTLQATIMAIREELMRYFKGTCIERLTTGSNIVRQSAMPRGRYQYQRQQAEMEYLTNILIGSVHILTLKYLPDTVIIRSCMSRSPELRKVKNGIEQFLDEYLAGVVKEIEPPVKSDIVYDDSNLLKAMPITEHDITPKITLSFSDDLPF